MGKYTERLLLDACKLMLKEHEQINKQYKQKSDTAGMEWGRQAIDKAEGKDKSE